MPGQSSASASPGSPGSNGESRLIVYGTLAPGAPNHHLLASLRGTWLEGYVTGTLVQTGWAAERGYPALRSDPDGPRVRAWMLRSPDLERQWPALDAFEGPAYRRSLVPFHSNDGHTEIGYLYEAAS